MNKYRDLQIIAQRERKVHKMCLGKRVYKSKDAAYQKGQRIYHCPVCGFYHRSGQFSALVAQVKKMKARGFHK